MIFWKLFRVFGRGENEENMTELSFKASYKQTTKTLPTYFHKWKLVLSGMRRFCHKIFMFHIMTTTTKNHIFVTGIVIILARPRADHTD